jgi:hypothetical protein
MDEEPPASPLVLSADSKAEALAFLSCLFDADDLAASSSEFIPVLFTDEVEREAGGICKKMHTIIIRPRNTTGSKPDIALDLLNHQAFEKALTAMGITHDRIDTLARESGYSPTILRRRLSKYPAIKTPLWTRDGATVRNLIPMMLVGAWHARSNADCQILSFLSVAAYDEIEKQIAAMLKFEDCPIWSVGQFRGVVSKIDAFFAVHDAVTQKDIEEFFRAAEIVLSETHLLSTTCAPFAKKEASLPREKSLCTALIGEYVRHLKDKAEIESEMTERILKSSISTLEAFNRVRNEQSFAHGNSILNYDESLLIFNHVTSGIIFITALENRKSCPEIRNQVVLNQEDEIPF